MPDPKVRFRRDYDEMTETQQEVIDTRAKNPDLTAAEIAEKVGVSGAYVNGADREAQDVIQQRREELGVVDELDKFAEETEAPGQESNANGRETTEGNVSVVGAFDATHQYWDERPVKNQLTPEQNQLLQEANLSDLQQRVIRAKLRNPGASKQEISEMIDAKVGTVSGYISMYRDLIEEISALPNQETVEEAEQTEDTEELYTFAFDRDEVIDLLSSNVDREMKERIFTEITNPE